jgi:hypothetical protein
MKRLLSLLLISTLLAAGCTVTTKPEPVPLAPQPEAAVTPVTAPEKPVATAPEPAQPSACGALNGAQPAAPALVVDSAWGSVDYATFPASFSRAPTCRVTIGGGEVRGWVMLPADAEESLARAALTVEGGTFTQVDWTSKNYD